MPSAQLNFLLTGLLPAEAEVEDRPLIPACFDFLDSLKWKRVLELATFDCFESLPDDIENHPETWQEWSLSEDNQGEAPSPYSEGECPQFASILLRRVLKPE